MKLNRNNLTIFASFAFLALASFPTPAKAQNGPCEGTFTLPYEVTWQNAQLPAGQYSFRMESKAFPARMIVKGPNGAFFVSAMGLSTQHQDVDSELLVESRDGKNYVRELYLAGYDLHLRYFVPKVKGLQREVLLAQVPSSTDHLAVLKGRK